MSVSQDAGRKNVSDQSSGPRVLVTDANRGSALTVIRALGRAGYEVIAGDCGPDPAGGYSRFTNRTLLYPSPTASPAAFQDWMLRAVREWAVDLVLPITDETILPLAEIRDLLSTDTLLGIAPQHALEITLDKAETFGLAESLNIPVPRTRLITSVVQLEADAVVATFSFPVVVKPQISRRYGGSDFETETLNVSYATSFEDLISQVRATAGRYSILVQEYHQGTGKGVELVARQGKVIAAFQHRRLAEVPLTGGASAWRISEALDPVLFGYASLLAAALQWNGPMMVEFKCGDSPVLMEINGRAWGSLPLSYMSGVDFPRSWADVFLKANEASTNLDAYRVGVRAYNPDLLLSWLGKNLLQQGKIRNLPFPSRRRFLPVLLGAMLRSRHDYFSNDDWRPFGVSLRHTLSKYSAKALTKVRAS